MAAGGGRPHRLLGASSRRREGHASRAVALALIRAKELGLQRVLLTCDEDNVGSPDDRERRGRVRGQPQGQAALLDRDRLTGLPAWHARTAWAERSRSAPVGSEDGAFARELMQVGRVLEAAEAASPVQAVEAVARELGLAFDAVAVSFLIADLSGRALVRLAHVPLLGGPVGTCEVPALGERREDEESATVMPFDGGPEQAVRTQTVQVLPPEANTSGDYPGLWGVLAPVTERGSPSGCSSSTCRGNPTTRSWQRSDRSRTFWRSS